MVDTATKYPEAVPLKYVDSQHIAEVLIEIFSRVGLTEEILNDHGHQFMPSVMGKFHQLLAIKRIWTSLYRAQCNGGVERFNDTLKSMIRKINHDDPDKWDLYLHPLLFAYRKASPESTGFSPLN